MRRYLGYYRAAIQVSILEQLQYRIANYLYLVGMVAEAVVYLVVWSTVARAQGGAVGGYTPGDLAAYYIVGMLVHSMNLVLSPYSWESRVKDGQLSGELLYPIHPLHHDVAYYAGSNLMTMVMSLPVVAVLVWIFKPALAPTAYQAVAFLVAIAGAYLIRTLELSLLGMITFWTTRVGAIFELYFALELLLSGRLVPMSLMPEWVQRVARYLPFQWALYFPIESLVGRLPPAQLLAGLGMQVLWIVLGIAAVKVVWRLGIRRYTAVGG